jgi:predicted glycoside hydrolase/deacetylase ChbG (UPF0249 family)
MQKILIVNADDGNLTEGVTQAIFDCHDKGILSSTTWMINLPHSARRVREAQARPNLGVGIHLNITLGEPVSEGSEITSLLTAEGRFRKVGPQLESLPRVSEVRREYRAQIEKFKKLFGRLPTHLDTHHQVHDHPFFLTILAELANHFKLPLRRSKLLAETTAYDFHFLTTDHLWGDLNPAGYWRREKLENVLKQLPKGINEVMCHPGHNDADLQAVSSFTAGRVEEMNLLADPALRSLLEKQGVQLSHFGVCYN